VRYNRRPTVCLPEDKTVADFFKEGCLKKKYYLADLDIETM